MGLIQHRFDTDLDLYLVFLSSGCLCAYVPGQPPFCEALRQLLREPAGWLLGISAPFLHRHLGDHRHGLDLWGQEVMSQSQNFLPHNLESLLLSLPGSYPRAYGEIPRGWEKRRACWFQGNINIKWESGEQSRSSPRGSWALLSTRVVWTSEMCNPLLLKACSVDQWHWQHLEELIRDADPQAPPQTFGSVSVF